jgi:tetrahydromethanopterin S-methyltransferase subunit G
MSNEDLILEILKHLQADNTEVRRRLDGIEIRLSSHDDHLRGLITSTTGILGELRQLNTRVDRIERRLDLVEP